MWKVLLVGAGGFAGSILRYLVGGWVQLATRSAKFPFGTLAVNIIGCFLIGVLAHLAEFRGVLTPETRTFLVVGVLGGFTTFSAFGNESLIFLSGGEAWLAAANVVLNVGFGLAAVWLGRSSAYLLWR